MRNFDATYLAHTFFTLFLFFEQFALSRDIAAVTFRRYVLADGFYRFAGYDFRPYGCLQRYVELLPGDEAAQFFHDFLTYVVGVGTVDKG